MIETQNQCENQQQQQQLTLDQDIITIEQFKQIERWVPIQLRLHVIDKLVELLDHWIYKHPETNPEWKNHLMTLHDMAVLIEGGMVNALDKYQPQLFWSIWEDYRNMMFAFYKRKGTRGSEMVSKRVKQRGLEMISRRVRRMYPPMWNKIKSNLVHPNAKTIWNRVWIEKTIALPDIASMSAEELYPEHWVGYGQGKSAIVISHRDEWDPNTQSLIVCGKCRKHMVSYYQQQTRGCDEAITTFCTCHNCGNKWRQ